MSVAIPTYKNPDGLIVTYLTPDQLDIVSTTLSSANKRTEKKRVSKSERKKESGRPTKPLCNFLPPRSPVRENKIDLCTNKQNMFSCAAGSLTKSEEPIKETENCKKKNNKVNR